MPGPVCDLQCTGNRNEIMLCQWQLQLNKTHGFYVTGQMCFIILSTNHVHEFIRHTTFYNIHYSDMHHMINIIKCVL